MSGEHPAPSAGAVRRRRIRIVVPIVASAAEMAQRFAVLGSAQTEVSVVVIERGPASIESQFEAALAVPEVLVAVRDAAVEGVDALIIDCMDDPGVGAARELVSIPVLGPAQTAMHLACLLARRFSIVAPEASAAAITAFEEQARHYGLREQLASVRGVDMPVLELRRDGERLAASLLAQSLLAVEQDRAQAIVFGCMAMFGAAAAVQDGLRKAGHPGIPVIDPLPVALRFAEALIDLGLAHSKQSYPTPPAKPVFGYVAFA